MPQTRPVMFPERPFRAGNVRPIPESIGLPDEVLVEMLAEEGCCQICDNVLGQRVVAANLACMLSPM